MQHAHANGRLVAACQLPSRTNLFLAPLCTTGCRELCRFTIRCNSNTTRSMCNWTLAQESLGHACETDKRAYRWCNELCLAGRSRAHAPPCSEALLGRIS